MKDNKLLKISIYVMIGLGAASTLVSLIQFSDAMRLLDVVGVFGGGIGFVKILVYLSIILRIALLGLGIYAFLSLKKEALDIKFLGMAGVLFIADIVHTLLMLISMLHTIDTFILISAASLAFFMYSFKKGGQGA